MVWTNQPAKSGGYYGGAAPTGAFMPSSNYPVAPPPAPSFGLGGYAPTGGGVAPPAAPITLTTQQDPALAAITGYGQSQMQASDPLLAEAAQNYRNRMSSDTTQRAIGVMSGAADDSLASAMQRAKEQASIEGTSAGSQAQRAAGMTDQNERNKAAGAAQITLGSEARLDALAGGFAGAAGASAGNRLGWGGLAASAAGAGANNQLGAQQNQISAAQLAAQQQAAQQQAMLNAYNLAYA